MSTTSAFVVAVACVFGVVMLSGIVLTIQALTNKDRSRQ